MCCSHVDPQLVQMMTKWHINSSRRLFWSISRCSSRAPVEQSYCNPETTMLSFIWPSVRPQDNTQPSSAHLLPHFLPNFLLKVTNSLSQQLSVWAAQAGGMSVKVQQMAPSHFWLCLTSRFEALTWQIPHLKILSCLLLRDDISVRVSVPNVKTARMYCNFSCVTLRATNGNTRAKINSQGFFM